MNLKSPWAACCDCGTPFSMTRPYHAPSYAEGEMRCEGCAVIYYKAHSLTGTGFILKEPQPHWITKDMV